MRLKLPVILLLLSCFAWASTQGPSLPSVASQDASGSGDSSLTWVHLPGIYTTGYASNITISGGAHVTNNLIGSGFNFTVPPSAIVNGIFFSFSRKAGSASSFSASTYRVSMMKAGASVGSAKGPGTLWTTTFTSETYGSASDLWGTTWTGADVDDPNFGVELSVSTENGGGIGTIPTAQVDTFQITVTYTATTSQAPAPSCTPGTGTYTKAQTVTCTDVAPVQCTATSGTPQTDQISGCLLGTLYTAPIFIPLTQNLIDVAGGTGYLDSVPSPYAYTINAPYAQVAPTSLVFPTTTVGSTSPAQTVMITNVGTTGMLIASIVASGNYAQSNNCPNPSTPLASGSSCTMMITFSPTSTGDQVGTLTITDTSTGNVGTQQVVSLDGTGSGTPTGALTIKHGIKFTGGVSFNAVVKQGGGTTPPLTYPARTDLCGPGTGVPGEALNKPYGCTGASSGQGSILKYQKNPTDAPPASGSVISGPNLFGLNSYLIGVNSAAMPMIDLDMGGQIYRATDAAQQAQVNCLGGGNYGVHFNMGSNGNPRRFNQDDTKFIITNSGGNQDLIGFNPINGQVTPSSICGGYLPGPATFDGADPSAFYTINLDQENTVPFSGLTGQFLTPETITQDTTGATATLLAVNSNFAQLGPVTGSASNSASNKWRDSGGAFFSPNPSFGAPFTGAATPYAVTIYHGTYCDGKSIPEEGICIHNPNPTPSGGPACLVNDGRPACWYSLMSLEYELTYLAALVGFQDSAAVIRFPSSSTSCIQASYHANYDGEFNTGDAGDTMSVVIGDNGQNNNTGFSGYVPPAGDSCPNSPGGICTGPVYGVAYRRGFGCRVLNPMTDLITGDWGPTGQAVNGQANITTVSGFTGSPVPGDVLIQDATLAGTTLTCEQNSSGTCDSNSAHWTQFQTGLIYGVADNNSAHKWRDCGTDGTKCGSTGVTNFFTPSSFPTNAPFIFPDVYHDVGQKADDLISSGSMVQQNAMQCSQVAYNHTTHQTTCTYANKTQFSPGQQFVFTGLAGAGAPCTPSCHDTYLNCVSANNCPIFTAVSGGAPLDKCRTPLCGVLTVTDTLGPASDYTDAEDSTSASLGSWGQDGIGGVHAGIAGNNFWQNRTLIVSPDLGIAGHSASGYAFDYQGKQYTALSNLNPSLPATTTGKPDGPLYPGYQTPPGAQGGNFTLNLLPNTITDDQHGFNRNHGLFDFSPVGFAAELTCGIFSGVGSKPCVPYGSMWDSELIAIENWVTRSSPGLLVGADCNYGAGPAPCVYRLSNSYCTDENWAFSIQNCIANISPDGQFLIWGSDWNRTLGCMDLISTNCISSWQATAPNASQVGTSWSVDGTGIATVVMTNSFCPPGGTQSWPAGGSIQCGTAAARVTLGGFTVGSFLNGLQHLGGNPVAWNCHPPGPAGTCVAFQVIGVASSHWNTSGTESGTSTQTANPETCNSGSLCARADVFIKRLNTVHQ